MADPPLAETATTTPSGDPAADRPPPRPRWVKVSALLALVAIVLLIVLLVAGGGGGHAPRLDGH